MSNWWIQTLFFSFPWLHLWVHAKCKTFIWRRSNQWLQCLRAPGPDRISLCDALNNSLIGSGSVLLVSLRLSVKRFSAASRDWPPLQSAPRREQSPLRPQEVNLRPRLATYWACDTYCGSKVWVGRDEGGGDGWGLHEGKWVANTLLLCASLWRRHSYLRRCHFLFRWLYKRMLTF